MPTITAPDPDKILQTDATSSVIGYRLRRAQLSVFQRFLDVFAELRIRPAEYSVLVLVGDNPGRKQTEIAQVLGIKRANFVTLIHGLEARGLIERRASAGDKRANALHLTGTGRSFVANARLLHDTLEADLIERLGGERSRDRLLALLDQLT